MCVFSSPSPSTPAVDPNAKIEADNKAAAAAAEAAKKKQDALEASVSGTTRGGSGSRSLLTGPKGGLGYYDETL